jgi:hypothetical protein
MHELNNAIVIYQINKNYYHYECINARVNIKIVDSLRPRIVTCAIKTVCM